jgi:hypothetical protein
MNLKNRISAVANWSGTLLIIFLLIFTSFSTIKGQAVRGDQFPYDQKSTDDTPPVKERLFYGGSFGLMFGTVTDIQISPVIGFWVLPRIAVAAGPTYRYYKDQIDRTALYGGRA